MIKKCICESEKFKIYSYINNNKEYKIFKCKNCGLGITSPSPLINENINNFYNNDDYSHRIENIKLWEKFTLKSLKILKKYKNYGKLLEVGSNVGIFIKNSINFGYDSFGIDISNNAIEFGKKHFNLYNNLYNKNIEDLINDNVKFDIIVYIHTLEHITDLTKELSNIYKLLNNDGVLFVEVPNFNSIWRKLLGSRWYGFSFEQHLWQFSKKSIKEILNKNNFKIIKINTKHSMYHKINFSIIGMIKSIILFLAFIFNNGDNLVIVSKKKYD